MKTDGIYVKYEDDDNEVLVSLESVLLNGLPLASKGRYKGLPMVLKDNNLYNVFGAQLTKENIF